MRNFFTQHHLYSWQESMPLSAQNYISPRIVSQETSYSSAIMDPSPMTFEAVTEGTE